MGRDDDVEPHLLQDLKKLLCLGVRFVTGLPAVDFIKKGERILLRDI